MSHVLRISEAANLGVHALVHLALAPAGTPCSVGVIARNLGVSESHLAKVMQRLVAAGLVESVRGARGGFRLGTDPAATSLLSILEAIDGPMRGGGCLLGRQVCLISGCWLSGLERQIGEWVQEHLGDVTLADVSRQTAAKPSPS
jgi:Rrf2 family protein